jgi:hypothetical protein
MPPDAAGRRLVEGGAGSSLGEAAVAMALSRCIRIAGYRLDRTGKLVKCSKHKDVSARLRERSSRKIRVVRTQKVAKSGTF